MPRHSLLRILCLGLVCCALTAIPATPEAIAQPGKHASQGGKKDSSGQQQKQNKQKSSKNGGQGMSAQQAAAQAQARYGGRVLKVEPRGDGYSVRLLRDDGRVITVSIGD